MECYERLESEGETHRSFSCFKTYRDLGPMRSLRRCAEVFYGQRWKNGIRTVEKWSSRFHWPERAAQRDEFIDSVKQKALADFEREQAEAATGRERQLQQKAFEVRELALDQCLLMLRYPLTQQTVQRESDDGTPQTVILRPAGWSKSTVKALYSIATDDTTSDPLAELTDALEAPSVAPEELSREEIDLVVERLQRSRR